MIRMDNVALGYTKTPVLKDLNLHIEKGEFVGIIGLSGAGKSTLLSSLIGNISILGGRYQVGEYDLRVISKKKLTRLRSRIGFIFQGYNLVNRLNVLHNIMSGMLSRMPLHRAMIKWYGKEELRKGYEYMQTVGLEQYALQRSDALSGGQRQRVAIARALAQEPDLLLADEPVAALDPISAEQVMEILRTINNQYGVTVVSNLHHLDFAKEYCSRILGIAEGTVVFDGSADELITSDLDRIYGTTTHDNKSIDRKEIDIQSLSDADELILRQKKHKDQLYIEPAAV
ncbi:MAG TPA: phosphonate ABC transporter ATP-binding protein [Desulfobulbaceae bacterium]|nr:phosphonate ABC transporter ATP-binding protein [Desulfobulbaceae bacterium]